MEEGIKKMEGGSDRPGFEFKKPLFPASAIRRAKPTRARQRGHLVTIRSNSPVASHRYLFSYPPKAATDCTDPNHLQAVAWLAGDGVKKHPDSNHRAPVNANIENKTVSVLSQYEANPETGVEVLFDHPLGFQEFDTDLDFGLKGSRSFWCWCWPQGCA